MKKMSRERKKAPFRGLSAVIGQGILDFKHGSTCWLASLKHTQSRVGEKKGEEERGDGRVEDTRLAEGGDCVIGLGG